MILESTAWATSRSSLAPRAGPLLPVVGTTSTETPRARSATMPCCPPVRASSTTNVDSCLGKGKLDATASPSALLLTSNHSSASRLCTASGSYVSWLAAKFSFLRLRR